MKFRINLYLKLKIFFKAILIKDKDLKKNISKFIKKDSKKKYFNLSSQLRVSFKILLKFLIQQYPQKKEIIFIDYNLPEMPNVAKNLNLKIIFNEINKKNWFFNFRKLKNQINNNTLAIVLTNMFNNYEDTLNLKIFCKKKNILLIEDNAIYFDNYSLKKNGKIHTGSIGDFSLYSFNIMKNISALYGGGVSHNSKKFYEFMENYNKSLPNFPKILLMKQILIFFMLKLFSNQVIYKWFFFKVVKFSYIKNIRFILKIFYPSLKFKVVKFPKYYFSKISKFSIKLIYLQLIDKNQRKYHYQKRLENNEIYYNLFKKLKINNLDYPDIKDKYFQNFIDFPIMIKKKKNIIKFLLDNNFEVRSFYYQDCKKIFNFKKKIISEFAEKIICLPNHKRIDKKYIEDLVNFIKLYS
jgi:dTDP-4-amino-4,6-dideoxygalactose transaminase